MNRVESVARRLRADIGSGRFHPRERLVEADLAATYGVTRSTLRAALLELEAEGLVERTPNRGARVRGVTIEEAIEITETRLALQAMCAREAALQGTDEQRDELRQLVAELRDAVERDVPERYVAANARIFALIREMSGQRIASGIVENLLNRHIQNLYPFMLPERRFASLAEFERIVAAVVARDADAAYRTTLEHRDRVVEALTAIRAGLAIPGAVG